MLQSHNTGEIFQATGQKMLKDLDQIQGCHASENKIGLLSINVH